MYNGEQFWNMICQWRWLFIILVIVLYIYQTFQWSDSGLGQILLYRLSNESTLWIYSVFAFGFKHLNKNSNALKYLSQGAYPIYIIHMIFIYLASYLIFPLSIDMRLKYLLVVVLLFVGSFAFYEFLIRRISFIRPFFGLKK